MHPKTAIIGGSGLDQCPDFERLRREVVTTPYGDPSGSISFGYLAGHEVIFIPRHGIGHTIAPHTINYRANIWALKSLGVKQVIAVNAVGGIDPKLAPTDLVLPDQIIDYTWGREHSFFAGFTAEMKHIEFTLPYCRSLRERMISASAGMASVLHTTGVYAATQGPRLETAAEIKRLARDGATIVGMTGMPEAALARELDLSYAAVTMVVNMAAGISTKPITMDLIKYNLGISSARAIELIAASL